MGFMDKAKKLAEQAQQKLDEAQEQLQPGRLAARRPAGRAASATTSTGARSRTAPPAAAAAAAALAPSPRRPQPPSRRAARRAAAAEPRRRLRARRRRQRRRRPPRTRPERHRQAVPDPFKPLAAVTIGGILTAMVTPFDATAASTRTRPCG